MGEAHEAVARPDGPDASSRRRTAGLALGHPRVTWAAVVVAFATIVFVGVWNAQRYPVPLGYDAQGHVDYAHVLLHQHRLPRPTETNEAGQPPGYYLVAGMAASLGRSLFGWHEMKPYTQMPELSYRGAQYLNLAAVLGTACLLLLLGKRLAPGRPEVWSAALLFFAFLPVVGKTAAMFHPDTLNMFLSTLAVWLTTRMAQDRGFSVGRMAMLAVTLSAGLMVRASTVFTVFAIVGGLTGYLLARRTGPFPWRKLGAIGAIGVVVATVFLGTARGRSFLGKDLAHAVISPTTMTSVSTRGNFTHVDLHALFSRPYRPNFVNQALPETYTEIWGDWIGVFAWSPYSITPWGPAARLLRDQNWIGVLPTVLAVAGWLLILRLALVRQREFLSLALLPPLAVGGYLYRSYQLLSSDGDLLKASYSLATAPIWALGFGVAFASLGRYPRARAAIGLCLLAFAILEFRFMLYGVRDHHPIF